MRTFLCFDSGYTKYCDEDGKKFLSQLLSCPLGSSNLDDVMVHNYPGVCQNIISFELTTFKLLVLFVFL
jgi:hypothetical protein